MKILRVLMPLAALSVLAACATPAPAITVQPSDRPQCPPGLLVPTEPQPLLPEGATVPRPIDAADAAGLELTLEHVAGVAAWGRRGWARADEARRWCESLRNRAN